MNLKSGDHKPSTRHRENGFLIFLRMPIGFNFDYPTYVLTSSVLTGIARHQILPRCLFYFSLGIQYRNMKDESFTDMLENVRHEMPNLKPSDFSKTINIE
jgi:hypothetical protein